MSIQSWSVVSAWCFRYWYWHLTVDTWSNEESWRTLIQMCIMWKGMVVARGEGCWGYCIECYIQHKKQISYKCKPSPTLYKSEGENSLWKFCQLLQFVFWIFSTCTLFWNLTSYRSSYFITKIPLIYVTQYTLLLLCCTSISLACYSSFDFSSNHSSCICKMCFFYDVVVLFNF